jgi:glycopeptide antibiotics resistance protein
MTKRLISLFMLLAYSALLIKIMVFKNIPVIRIGQLMLNFGGTHEGPANLIPFKTILPYLMGEGGLIIGGLNIGGNIVLLIPIGFLVPFVFQKIDWKITIAISIVSGLAIELAQVFLKVGIFDIDDVILNALGVMIGYWTYTIFPKTVIWIKANKIVFAVIICFISALIFFGVSLFQKSLLPMHLPLGAERNRSGLLDNRKTDSSFSKDPCNGTGGTGQIISMGNDSIFTIKRRDGLIQKIKIWYQTKIRNAARDVSLSELKIGDRVTLVVQTNNNDGSMNATLVLICNSNSTAPGE